VSPDYPHNNSTYCNLGCRCATCTAAHRRYKGDLRAQRLAQRVLVDGRLVHPHARHGEAASYHNWGCRCPACTEATRVRYGRPRRAGAP
jgi:hypothetical protein